MKEEQLMRKRSKAEGAIVVFDLDGTLVDSAKDLVATLNTIIADEGLAPIPRKDVGQLVGQGALKMIEKAYDYHQTALSPETRTLLHQKFLDIYSANIAKETRPFDGVIDVLNALKENGWTLAVCTNKYEGLSKNLLNQLQLDHYFAAICGSDTFPMKKPDPEHLFRTIQQASANPKRAIMVGDSITDIKTAKAAAIPVIGVTFGYSDVEIETLNPDSVVTDFGQMLAAIVRLSENFD